MNVYEIYKIVSYVIIYSFGGWILESVYKTILFRKWINSGFLIGPFCPIYGFGALIMMLVFENLKGKYILLFLSAIFVLSIWEYLVGVFLEKVFKTKYWDYSQNKFNFQGRICLLNSLIWGILAIIFTDFLHPQTTRFVDIIPQNILMYTVTTISIYIVVDMILSIIKVNNINIRLKLLSEIKEKLNLERVESIANELKEKQAELTLKIEKQIKKLQIKFPTMKSQIISNYLAEKKEKIEERVKRLSKNIHKKNI